MLLNKSSVQIVHIDNASEENKARFKRSVGCTVHISINFETTRTLVDTQSRYSKHGVQIVKSKEAFVEELARNNDVHILHYQCDNGVYQSKLPTMPVSISSANLKVSVV
jgi:hypothetical protein